MKTWVITDIHGCANTFKALLKRIDFNREDTLYLLGDYIDRGPDSKGVLDHILQLQQTEHRVHCLLGNHEIMMLHARQNPLSLEAQQWLHFNGGVDTLHSFGVVTVQEVDSYYLDFMESMAYYREVDRYILVHAGLNLSLANPFSDKNAMLWIRGDQTLNKKWLDERIIIHGHTPQSTKQVQQNVAQMEEYPIVDIDSGCVYHRPGHHHLCALDLHSHKLVFQENVDD